MALRQSLLITGDASGAEAALNSVDQGMAQNEAKAEQLARAYADADRAIKQLATAQALATREMNDAKAALDRGEISLETYKREVLETKSALSIYEAQHRSAMNTLRQSGQVMDTVTASAGQQRAGMQQLGYQLGDVATMYSLGAKPAQIFASQIGQVTQAVQMMGGGTSRFAAFLGGPWGIAMSVGLIALSPFVAKLFEGEEAIENVTFATYGLKDAQSILGSVMDLTTGKINTQNKALIALAKAQLLVADAQAKLKLTEARAEISGLSNSGAKPFGGPLNVINILTNSKDPQLRQLASQVAAGVVPVDAAIDKVQALQKSGSLSKTDALKLTSAYANAAVEQENIKLTEQALKDLKAGTASDQFRTPGKSPRSSSPRSKSSGSDRGEPGDDIAARIAGIRDQFSDLPAEVERANKAMRQLDDIASDVERRRPPNYAQLKPALDEARKAIENSLIRPFTDYVERAREAEQIDRLLIAGKEDEAAALQDVLRLQERQGPLSDDQLETVLATVRAEKDRALEIRRQNALYQAQVNVIDTARQGLADMLSGRKSNLLGNIKQAIADLRGARLFDKLFGDAFDQIERELNKRSPLGIATKDLAQSVATASNHTDKLASATEIAAKRILGAVEPSYDPGGTLTIGPDGVTRDSKPIEAVGAKPAEVKIDRMSIDELADRMADATIDPLLEGMKGVFGTNFTLGLGQVLKGAFAGYVKAGEVGAGIGGVKKLVDVLGGEGGKLSELLGTAGAGASFGYQAASILDSLGINVSKSGAAAGGAAGAAIGGPVGMVIGALGGGVLGKLIGSTKRGSATVTGVDSAISTRGNSGSRIDAASGLAGSVQDYVARIAEALGGETGNFAVSIGLRKNNYRVDPTGRGITKTKNGAVDFGTDQDAALSYAIANAVADGGVKGLSAAVQKALKSSPDIEKALAEALKVQDLELALGGIGAELRKAFADFERQAAERLRIAKQYGFDVVEVEKRNAEDRLKLSQDLLAQQVGGLQDLIDQMTSGSLFEGSATDRRQALLDQIATAKTAADAGDADAASKLADLFDQLNSVSKEVYGTTGGFAADRSTILDQARDTIARANERISQAQAASDPALAATNAALDENNDQNAAIIAALGDTNTWLAKITAATGGTPDYAALAALARTNF